jgi:ATP-dependent RNA helicase RhlE
MGFIRDIRKILALLPQVRQNLLFSATFSDEIRALAGGMLRDPQTIQVARRNADAELVSQRIHPVDRDRKRELLVHLVNEGNWQQVLVFTRTKHGANGLAERLSKSGLEAAAIHGNKSQGARTRALADFKAGDVRVLVATDIAARGLDIEELPHVVNYELPNVPEDYVHRIGRTGRAGSSGEALSLVSQDERAYLADIEKLLGRRLERVLVPGFEPSAAGRVADEQRAPVPPRSGHRTPAPRRERAHDARAPARGPSRSAGAQAHPPRHRAGRPAAASMQRRPAKG